MGKVKITLIKNGSAKVDCDKTEIVMLDGSVVVMEGSFFLCRCGHSKNKPFCDGSHSRCGFRD
ncbi:MAG: CDGSH iron-sulfur domain-containing protein [Candidatus Zixiibacteriota bacterium]|nr:MAG: CDGSH iron-sulfur domain-containing protein [candidate division Zixibacteria bacterium]